MTKTTTTGATEAAASQVGGEQEQETETEREKVRGRERVSESRRAVAAIAKFKIIA